MKVIPMHQVAEIQLAYKPAVPMDKQPRILGAEDAARVFREHWNPDTIQLFEEMKMMLLNRDNRGINAILLNIAPYEYPLYLTFKQAKELGKRIKKGAKAELMVYYGRRFKNADGKTLTEEEAGALPPDTVRVIPTLRYYHVFNVAHVEDLSVDLPLVEQQKNSAIASCETLIKGIHDPPKVECSKRVVPAYIPKRDLILLPTIHQFESSEEFYNTLFHELTHATGHERRLNRQGITDYNPYGTPMYSMEELIAELGASYLCSMCGINREDIMSNNAAYIAGWLEQLREDKRLIFKASSQAKRAVKWIVQENN